MITFALHDQECRPLGIVTLDWDVEKRGPYIKIPLHRNLTAEMYEGNMPMHMAQAITVEIMDISLSPLRNNRPDGSLAEGWIGTTSEPEICEKFFEMSFR